MNDDLNISDITVASLLKSSPESVRFFLNWRLGCVGCGFARFCTLGDVVATYQIDEKPFLEEARKLVVHTTLSRSSE